MPPYVKKLKPQHRRSSSLSTTSFSKTKLYKINFEALEKHRLLLDKIISSSVLSVVELSSNLFTMNTNVSLNIFNSLRIPDAVKDMPSFDGNPHLLFDFLNNVEEILSHIQSIAGTGYSQIILRAIRNKITGPANEVLNMYGTSTNWVEIKSNLITHYADKRNETSLIRDLHQLRQDLDSVETFYAKIIHILSTIMNHVRVHEKNQTVIEAKKTLYEEMCLNALLSGLREPLGSTIRAMRPSKLTEALNFCLEEQNRFYFRNSYYAQKPSQIRPLTLRPQANHYTQYSNQNFPTNPYSAHSQSFSQNLYLPPRIQPPSSSNYIAPTQHFFPNSNNIVPRQHLPTNSNHISPKQHLPTNSNYIASRQQLPQNSNYIPPRQSVPQNSNNSRISNRPNYNNSTSNSKFNSNSGSRYLPPAEPMDARTISTNANSKQNSSVNRQPQSYNIESGIYDNSYNEEEQNSTEYNQMLPSQEYYQNLDSAINNGQPEVDDMDFRLQASEDQ